MNTPTNDLQTAKALDVNVTNEALTVDLADGRTLAVPLAWYPRLLHGTPEERRNWRLTTVDEGASQSIQSKSEAIWWQRYSLNGTSERRVFGQWRSQLCGVSGCPLMRR